MPAARTGPRPAPPPPAAPATAAGWAGPRPPVGGTPSPDQAVAAMPQPCADLPKSNQGERRGNSARIAGDPRPGKTSPNRPTSRGRRAAPGRPRPRGSSATTRSRPRGRYGGPSWPGACQPALAVPARQHRGGRGQDRNLPCHGQRLTAQSTANTADKCFGGDEDERVARGDRVRRILLGGSRLGRQPILARAPGEDGPNL